MRRFLLIATVCLLSAGCATAPLNRAGSLASYDGLEPSDGVLTKAIVRIDKEDVLGARTVRLVETRFSTKSAAEVSFSPDQRRILGNAIDRALCFGLSERFEIVGPADQADLTIQAVITHAAATDPAAAGASGVARVAKAVLLPGVPVPIPRIPLGLGSLSVEGEARDRWGKQKAAMVWGRGANSFTSSPRLSPDGDAYDLSTAFAADFSRLLVTGSTPFGTLPALPSLESLHTSLGGAPKQSACDVLGRAPGIAGFIGQGLGAPPSWTDKGATPPVPPAAAPLVVSAD